MSKIEIPEDVDTSQWLPKGAAIYTAERLAKGDIRVDAHGQPRAVPATILTVLHDREIITDEHVEAARRFMVWRAMMAHALGVDRIKAGMNAEGRECQEDSYVALVKLMPTPYLNTVTEACDRSGVTLAARLQVLMATDRTAFAYMIRSLRNTYLDALNALEEAVERITNPQAK